MTRPFKLIQLFSLVCLLGCENSNSTKKQSLFEKTSTEDFQFLYQKLTGRRYEYKPGEYDRKKTLVFFIDRHNEAVRDYIIDSMLHERNLLATDSSTLKTVTLIYRNINKLPLSRYIDGTNHNDSSDFIICYVDLETMYIRKMITFNDTGEFRPVLGKKVIETYQKQRLTGVLR